MKEMKYGKLYVCKTPWLMDYLVSKGFSPIKVTRDYYQVSKLVWLFENSPKLEAVADEYFEVKRNNKLD